MRKSALFFLLALILLCIASVPSTAQAKLKVSGGVVLYDDEAVRRDIERGIQARLNSTERYEWVGNTPGADLHLRVVCMLLVTEANYRHGVVCRSEIDYYPFKETTDFSSTLTLAQTMATSPLTSTTFIIETVMNEFINGTTDFWLQSYRDMVRSQIENFCKGNPSVCMLPSISKTPNATPKK